MRTRRARPVLGKHRRRALDLTFKTDPKSLRSFMESVKDPFLAGFSTSPNLSWNTDLYDSKDILEAKVQLDATDKSPALEVSFKVEIKMIEDTHNVTCSITLSSTGKSSKTVEYLMSSGFHTADKVADDLRNIVADYVVSAKKASIRASVLANYGFISRKDKELMRRVSKLEAILSSIEEDPEYKTEESVEDGSGVPFWEEDGFLVSEEKPEPTKPKRKERPWGRRRRGWDVPSIFTSVNSPDVDSAINVLSVIHNTKELFEEKLDIFSRYDGVSADLRADLKDLALKVAAKNKVKRISKVSPTVIDTLVKEFERTL